MKNATGLMISVAISVVGSLGACRSPPSAPGSAPDAPQQDATSASASAVAASSSSAVASASASAPLKVLNAQEAKAYQAALERGRVATVKKDWTGACAAFDQALALAPGDPRAFSERGYARLLSQDLEGADKDFRAAQGHTSEKKLDAQIWYNIGLVAEQRGKTEEARLAFSRSYSLNPLAVTQNKLNGKSSCVVGTHRALQAPKHFTDWLAAWKGLNPKPDAGTTIPVSVREARDALGTTTCVSSCIGNTDYESRFHLFFVRTDQSLDVHEAIGEGRSYRCGGPPSISINAGDPVHVMVANRLTEVGFACFNQGTPAEECRMNCGGATSWYRNDLFFDPTTHDRLLALSQSGSSRDNEEATLGTEVKVDATGVEFGGGGCKKSRVVFRAP